MYAQASGLEIRGSGLKPQKTFQAFRAWADGAKEAPAELQAKAWGLPSSLQNFANLFFA